MAQQVATSVENNFTKGLITEATGLNFPENAATDTDNCVYTLIGNVKRRQGIDFEKNAAIVPDVNTGATTVNVALNSYVWKNAGGDGERQILVQQRGETLSFFLITQATDTVPLSNQAFSGDGYNNFQISGTLADLQAKECQFTDGNGYLFVFHPLCTPFYVTLNYPAVTFTGIDIKIRDFSGIPDGLSPSQRPSVLSVEHSYNLTNQGWVIGNPWQATSTSVFTIPSVLGAHVFSIGGGLPIVLGDIVQCYGQNNISPFVGNAVILSGTVTAYAAGNLTVNVTAVSPIGGLERGGSYTTWTITPTNTGYVGTWFTAEGNYPSNSDVWWYFKNASGVFSPATTQPNVAISIGNAPRGHFVIPAFSQTRTAVSGITGITDVTTGKRPSTGTWFQGRVWYTGIDDSQQPIGNAPYYTWTENIYFSQIVTTSADFGNCFQTNDPTSETLFDLLPTDGGVITIQGAGKIYKLFPLQNALLIFAANGVWYLTGSQGIGFTANDYTIVKLSSVRSISGTSFTDVKGLPYFWNEEGIYAVEPAKQGTSLLSTPLHVNPLEVNPITVGTIQSFYAEIPALSKVYARGAYDPVEYKIQWIYKNEIETDLTSRYQFDRILNYNIINKAFYPYTVSGIPKIHTIDYISNPGSTAIFTPAIKYYASDTTATKSGFADEFSSHYVDFFGYNNIGINYESFFITGFKLKGQAIHKFQPQYIQVYSKVDGTTCGYKIQGIWNYALTGDSGKFSNMQAVTILGSPNFGTIFKRHKIRGSGYVLQFKITSRDGLAFDIQGWAVVDTVNAGT